MLEPLPGSLVNIHVFISMTFDKISAHGVGRQTDKTPMNADELRSPVVIGEEKSCGEAEESFGKIEHTYC